MNNEVVIVGGGVIGLSIARELHRRGMTDICLVDAGVCAEEASWAAGGMLAPQAEADTTGPFFELCSRSRDLYPSVSNSLLEETGIDIGLDRSGTFYLAFSEAESEALHERLERQRAVGLAVDLLDSGSILRAEPFVSPDVREGLFFERDWQVDNRKLCSALRRYCDINGIAVLENTRVTGIELGGKEVRGVRTDSGAISAAEVVLAAGAWTSNITLGDEPMPINVEPVLGQMIAFQMEARSFQRVIYCSEGYIVPRRDGRVLAGSTTEKTGFERKTSDAAKASLFAMACKIGQGFSDLAIKDHWCGLRPRAADGFPIIGRLDGVDGLFIATAHYRNGILLAPVTASTAADVIAGGKTTVLEETFGPDRFHSLASSVGI